MKFVILWAFEKITTKEPEYFPYVALNKDGVWVVYLRGKWHTEDDINYYMTDPHGPPGILDDSVNGLYRKMLSDLHRGIETAKWKL